MQHWRLLTDSFPGSTLIHALLLLKIRNVDEYDHV